MSSDQPFASSLQQNLAGDMLLSSLQQPQQNQQQEQRDGLKTSQSRRTRVGAGSPNKQLIQTMNQTGTKWGKSLSQVQFVPVGNFGKSMIDVPFKDPTFKPLLPSRFNVNDKVKQITYVSKEVLVELEEKIEQLEFEAKNEASKVKEVKKLQPSAFRVKQPQIFKNKPLRRQESDFQMYKEIFVAPKEKKLEDLKEKEKDFENLFHHDRAKQYEKILHIYNEENEKLKANAKFLDGQQISSLQKYMGKTLTGANPSLKGDIMAKTNNQLSFSPRKEAEKVLNDNIQILEATLQLDTTHPKEEYFFDQQIQVQPPDLPNASIASPLTPGNGYAPSVPLTHNFKDGKSNIKDLLVRAKAGMQAGDIQKEAHLSFYLGMVYEANKQYAESIKFYTQFFKCAKKMEDKIGLALGANRIAVNYFNVGNFEKSIIYHEQNIQLSDVENSFAGFYNIGISYRKIDCTVESIMNFKKALEWAHLREEIESKCLAFGQLGVTYFLSGQFEEALQNFQVSLIILKLGDFAGFYQNCRELSIRIGNKKLQLDCLLHITKITSKMISQDTEGQIQILKDAIECSGELEDKRISSMCMCNLGIMEGNRKYNYSKNADQGQNQAEDFDENDEEEAQLIEEQLANNINNNYYNNQESSSS